MNSNKKRFSLQMVVLSLSLALLSACSSVDKTLYKDARTLPPLEIPPNLIAPETSDGVEMTTQTDDVIAGKSALIWERDGGLIMVLNLDYTTAWMLIGEILKAQDFLIKNASQEKGLYDLQLQGVSKQLSVEDRGVKTVVTIIDSKKHRDHSDEAYQVLSKIHAELK